jgi:hypothetical protein
LLLLGWTFERSAGRWFLLSQCSTSAAPLPEVKMCYCYWHVTNMSLKFPAFKICLNSVFNQLLPKETSNEHFTVYSTWVGKPKSKIRRHN